MSVLSAGPLLRCLKGPFGQAEEGRSRNLHPDVPRGWQTPGVDRYLCFPGPTVAGGCHWESEVGMEASTQEMQASLS